MEIKVTKRAEVLRNDMMGDINFIISNTLKRDSLEKLTLKG